MRRGVVQAGLAYLVVGWLLIQIADATAPILGLPGWVPPFVTYSTIIGLPICLILAWALEHSKGRVILDKGQQSGNLLAGLERNYLAVIAAYGIATMGAGAYQALVGFQVETAADAVAIAGDELLPVEPNSIAVLKFLNINDDESAQIFSDGLGDDVLDRLAKIPGLSVASRGDSWSLPVNATSDQVRRRLRVAYFVEGSVRLVGEDLRVIVQLIESASGFHVFSRSFDRKLRDFLSVQREITNLTVANLRVALPTETRMPAALDTNDEDPDLDAYVQYRRGKALLDDSPTVATIDQAITYFQSALAIDDGYSAAYAGICRAFVSRHELLVDSESIDRANEACAAALQANPNLGVVYVALGNFYQRTGKNAEAESAFRHALEINAQDVSAMRGLAINLQRDQQLDDAESLILNAISLQPGNWRAINTLGEIYFVTGRYAEAAHAYRQIVFLDPDNWIGHGNLGTALLMSGYFADGLQALQTSLRIESDSFYLSNLGAVYYYLGQFDRSVEIHRQAVEKNPESNIVWLNLGDSLRFSTQADQAADAYRSAMKLSADSLTVNPNSGQDLYIASWASAASGDKNGARTLIERALNVAPDDPYVRFYDGLIKYHSGEPEQAMDALKKAVDMGYPPKMLAADPLLSDLHKDRQFKTILGET
jgi:TolB-like protein/cytochrome c-type biogenesis protein CcmH/NrfG